MNYSSIAFVFVALSLMVAPLPSLAATTASFDMQTLTATTPKPTIKGTSDAEKVRVLIENEKGTDLYKKDINVKKGAWSAKVSKTLPVGEYRASLYSYDGKKRTLQATTTLTVLAKGSKVGKVSVSQVPLLMGGTALPGSSVPVAYVRLQNMSSATTTVSGITLVENGSAPDAVVIGFATSDDKGGSRATIGGTEGTASFKKGKAFVELNATLAPNQMRIYTVKAILSKNSGTYAGTTLMIDIAGATVAGTVAGTFPIRGTTFTLSR